MTPIREGTMSAQTGRQRGGEKAIKTTPYTIQLFAGIQLIARFTRDESETRRNNECQDLTTEKRRQNHQDQTKHSPTFRRNSSSLVMNPSTRRNNECQDLTTRKEDSQDAAYKGGTPSESSMSSAQMNPSRYQQEVNVKTSRNGGTEEKREGGANGRKTKRQEKRMNRLRQ